MIPGRRVEAVYSFCDIRNFTDCTECLQEKVIRYCAWHLGIHSVLLKVFLYVNSVASIAHYVAKENRGAPNKCDAFCEKVLT